MAENLLGSPYAQDLSSLTFANTYSDNPWEGITTNQRTVYDPFLRELYRDTAIFAGFVNYTQGLVGTKTMQIDTLINMHTNFNQIGLRDIWMTPERIDSKNQQITFGRYGGKVAYHKYDRIINFWKAKGGASSYEAIEAILRNQLGAHMIEVQDMLARNAFLGMPYQFFQNDKTSFGTLSPEDKASTSLLNEIQLGMQFRRTPYARNPDGSANTIVCITTPGVIFDLQNQTDPKDWLWPNAYANPQRLLNYEVGTYRNVRFISHPKTMLMNCGAIAVQSTVTTAINAGDGSPDPATTKVDQTYQVGQAGARHYVQLAAGTSAADMAKYSVGDWVTIHSVRTNTFGVTGGVDYRDGTLENRRVVDVDATNKRLSFADPVMIDFTTDLGGGVYAYVTRGVHIHPQIFLGGPDGIVMGVGEAPRMYAPMQVDDFNAMYRFSWDSYQGYTVFNPNVIEVAFSGGSFRWNGALDDQS